MLQQNLKNTELGKIPIEWELESFENIAVNKGLIRGPFGGALKKEMFKPSGYKVYEQQNAIYQSIDLGNYFIDQQKYSELKRFAVKANDFILSCSGTIGKLYHIPNNFKEGVINQALLLIRLDSSKIDYKYFENQFNSNIIQNKILNVQGGAMKNLVGMDQIRKVKFIIPSLPEQKAIADCLSTWDEAIEKQTKLIAAKEQRKKGLMQQLLSGKKRLPGFEKKWKLHSIEELFIFKNGKAHENVIDEEGKFILINSKFISSNSQVVKRTNKNLSPLKIDDLVFVMSDVPKGKALGKFFYVDKDGLYTLNQRIGLLQIKTGNPKFMYYLLNRNRHFLSFDNGVGQTNLRKDDILECPLLIPDLDEQNEIANFISFIDREYQLELLKLDKLKTQKKGMMQKLLTGKIRLIA